tara:strand:+ start:5222 stop:5824 length:603 start_codon:yes stop_codon:yes gene_type:complete
MGFLDKLIQSVFTEKSVNITYEPSGELVKKPLKRSEKFMEIYNNWVENQGYNFIIRSIFEEWQTRNEISSPEASFFYYDTEQSNGFLHYFEKGTPKDEVHYLLELFSARVKKLDYSINHQEEQMSEEESFVKIKEVIYLKPKLRYRMETPYQQLYGNIHIECVWHDGEPYYIKVMANYFSDRAYDLPSSFDELVAHLFVF